MIRVPRNGILLGLIVTVVLTAVTVQFLTWRCFSVRTGRYAIWIATLQGRMNILIGKSATGAPWEQFYEQKFPDGRWTGFFKVINIGDGYNRGFGYNITRSSVFSRLLGFWYYDLTIRSTRVFLFQIPAWPFWMLAGLMGLPLLPRRKHGKGFDITISEPDTPTSVAAERLG